MPEGEHLFGWVKPTVEQTREVLRALPHPIFSVAAPHLMRELAVKRQFDESTDVYVYKAWKDDLGKYPSYPAQQIGDCFVGGTMVLGERIRSIEDVDVGDQVWTGEGRSTTVISRRALQAMNPLVEISTQGSLPIKCTADHKVMVYRLDRVCGKRVTPNLYKRAIAGAKGIGATRVISSFESRSPTWVAAGDLRDTDCLLTPVGFDPISSSLSSGDLFDSRDGRFILGYFLGNGHANRASVELTLPLGSQWTSRIMSHLSSHGCRPKWEAINGKSAERIRIHSVDLAAWFMETFYERSKGHGTSYSVKSFPGSMVGDRSFLDGLVAADGTRYDDKNELTSTSLSIVYGAYASLVTDGFEPVVGECCRSEGVFENAKPLYRVTWLNDRKRQKVWRDQSFVCRPVKGVSRIEGPTTVYDIGVKDDHHSFLANGHAVSNCTSFGSGHSVDLLECVQIVLGHKSESYKETCTEAIYGCGREIANMLGGGDGCYGGAVAQACTEFGIVPREVVGEYSGQRARSWGATGTPQAVKDKMALHKVGTASLVSTWDELVAALTNGYPVLVCSNQGFSLQRNEKGICEASGSWAHCMGISGIMYSGTSDEGAVIDNSWGDNSTTGPQPNDLPPFSWVARRRVVERMLAGNDSYALSSFNGYPGQPLPAAWTYAGWSGW